MFVAFSKDVPGSDIKSKDVREVPDAIGRAYTESGYGTETDAMSVIRAENESRFARMEANITKVVKDAVKPNGNPPAYRAQPDGSLEIEGIERELDATHRAVFELSERVRQAWS